MSPPNEVRFQELQTCLGFRLPNEHPMIQQPCEHAQCSIRGIHPPEFRTRFHRKPENGVLELGRVGVCNRHPEKYKTQLQTYKCKTGIYNMLEGKGQSEDWEGAQFIGSGPISGSFAQKSTTLHRKPRICESTMQVLATISFDKKLFAERESILPSGNFLPRAACWQKP